MVPFHFCLRVWPPPRLKKQIIVCEFLKKSAYEIKIKNVNVKFKNVIKKFGRINSNFVVVDG